MHRFLNKLLKVIICLQQQEFSALATLNQHLNSLGIDSEHSYDSHDIHQGRHMMRSSPPPPSPPPLQSITDCALCLTMTGPDVLHHFITASYFADLQSPLLAYAFVRQILYDSGANISDAILKKSFPFLCRYRGGWPPGVPSDPPEPAESAAEPPTAWGLVERRA